MIQALALLVSVSTSQICNMPTGIARFTEPICAPASMWDGRIIFNVTQGCVALADGGQWKCLLEADQASASSQGTELLSSPPLSPAPGRSYFDTTKGCQQTWTGSAWSPATCPITSLPPAPQPPNTLLSPSATPPFTTVLGASYFDTSMGCIRTWNGTAFSVCSPSTQPMPPNTLLSPASSPPVTSIVGATFYDTSNGCLRTWNGTTYSTCPAPAPSAPNLLLSPAATPPSTTVIGATYYDTAQGCLRTWGGSTFSACAAAPPVPPNTLLSPSSSTPPGTWPDGTGYYNASCKRLLFKDSGVWATCPAADVVSPPSYATPPSGTFPNGSLIRDTTLNCTREYSGSAWGGCKTSAISQDFTVTALTLPLAGVTYTVTVQGAEVGRPCLADGPGTGFLTIGIAADCRVTAANTLQVRFSGLGIALVGGTYRVHTWVK